MNTLRTVGHWVIGAIVFSALTGGRGSEEKRIFEARTYYLIDSGGKVVGKWQRDRFDTRLILNNKAIFQEGNGNAGLYLIGKDGHALANLFMENGNKAGLILKDTKGNPRIEMTVDKNEASLVLKDERGKVVFSKP